MWHELNIHVVTALTAFFIEIVSPFLVTDVPSPYSSFGSSQSRLEISSVYSCATHY